MGAGKVLLAIGIPLVGVAAIGGIAYAASRPATASGTTGPSGPDPNALALNALRTGDPSQIDLVARTLMGSGFVAQAGAIKRTATFIQESVLELPADISGMIVASIKSGDETQQARTGAAIKANYPVAAVNLETVSKVVAWLKAGAPGSSPVTQAAATAAVATGGAAVAAGTAPVTSAPAIVSTTVENAGISTNSALLSEIASTIASGNLVAMRNLATRLRAAGFLTQASDIERIIAQLESAQQSQVATTGSPLPAPIVVAPSSPTVSTTPVATPAQATTAVVTASTPITTTTDPRWKVAGKVQTNVSGSTVKTYDRKAVQDFERQEGLKPDGMFGSAVARVLGDKYGYVPPNPMHWGKAGLKGNAQYKSYLDDIASYRSWLQEKRAADSARDSEWAARLATLPKK